MLRAAELVDEDSPARFVLAAPRSLTTRHQIEDLEARRRVEINDRFADVPEELALVLGSC
jgi:hypothetical protein